MFLLQEDEALKSKIQSLNLTVATAANSAQPVPVYFGLPQQEERRRAFPYITIDLVDIVRDTDREMRGYVDSIGYLPDTPNYNPVLQTTPDWNNNALATMMPIPVRLYYQITTWSRFSRQNRQMLGQLLTFVLTPRFGWLVVTEDNTYRWLDLEFIQPGDLYEPFGPNDSVKRLFRTIIRVSVTSEIFVHDLELVPLVQGVAVTGVDSSPAYTDEDNNTTPAQTFTPINL